MADKEKKVGAKKWLKVLGALVFVAVVVVAVILLIPANTYSMIEALQANEKTFLLKDASYQIKYDDFANKIKTNDVLDYYSDEVDDVLIISQTMSEILTYYNEYMVFAEDNDTLSKNYKIINKNIKSADKIQKNIEIILDDALKLDDESTSYLQNSWIDFRIEFKNYLECYYNIFVSLNNCYQGCFEESITNNKASKYILNTINDYVYCIVNDFKVIISIDEKGDVSIGNYLYNSKGKVNHFENFVDKYIVDNTQIIEYQYDTLIINKFEKIEKFFTIYNETNFTEIINSISPVTNEITKTYPEITDTEGLYTTVKIFL